MKDILDKKTFVSGLLRIFAEINASLDANQN